ncbi:MAG: hypothetical protein AAF726_01100 [Planctomycetota bacterium]
MPIALAIVAAPLAAAQVPVFEDEALNAPDPQLNARLGDSIAMNDAYLCSGVSRQSGALSAEGSVVTWPRVGPAYGPARSLMSPAPSVSGQFGYDIALSGAELFVSELSSVLQPGLSRSAVHVYAEGTSNWEYLDSVFNPGVGLTNQFGFSIDADGDLLVVGAPNEFVQFRRVGAAYVFRRVGGVWQLDAQLTASDGVDFDRFGDTVAVSGGRVLVGAPTKQSGTVLAGAAYVYEFAGGGWVETARLAVDDGSGDDGFGVSLDLDGTTAVVGAVRNNGRGATYVFDATGGSWTREARLQPHLLSTDATFGRAVAVLGDQLVVGAYQDEAAGAVRGSAWVFDREPNAWSARVRLIPSGDSLASLHGFAVALDGAGSFAVGGPLGSAPGAPVSSGEIRTYRPRRSIGVSECDAVENSTGEAGTIAALGSRSAVADRVTLIAYQLPVDRMGYFLSSRERGLVNQPGGSRGVLCLGGAIGRYVGRGDVQDTSTSGMLVLDLELARTPTPTGFVSIAAGETWRFQAWHRDMDPGPTSNFTDAVAVSFR